MKPTRGRVLLAPIKEAKRESPIELVGGDRWGVRRGRVVAIGADHLTEIGQVIASGIKPGDVVLYPDRNQGTPVEGGLIIDVRELVAVEE